MKTFKDLKETELKEFLELRDNAVKEYKKTHKIKNLLLVGVGYFGNRVVSEIPDTDNVFKLYTDTNPELLSNFSEADSLLFSTDSNGVDELKENIARLKMQTDDSCYVIICTNSDDETNLKLTEIIAYAYFDAGIRFLIVHSGYNFLHHAVSEEKSSEKTKIFTEKMKAKKYLIHEIPSINTIFVYDRLKINFPLLKADTLIMSSINSEEEAEINIGTLAKVLELNIMKMLEV